MNESTEHTKHLLTCSCLHLAMLSAGSITEQVSMLLAMEPQSWFLIANWLVEQVQCYLICYRKPCSKSWLLFLSGKSSREPITACFHLLLLTFRVSTEQLLTSWPGNHARSIHSDELNTWCMLSGSLLSRFLCNQHTLLQVTCSELVTFCPFCAPNPIIVSNATLQASSHEHKK